MALKQHRLTLPETDARFPARLSIKRHSKPLHVIIGISRQRTFGITDLVAAWISERFARRFVAARPRNGGSLAADVFYDEVSYLFRDKTVIGVIGLEPDTSSHTDLLECVDDAGLVTFKRRGLAHAFFNEGTGRVQVTLDHLPGAIEFVTRPSAKMTSPAMLPRHADIITWYGLGELEDGQQDAIDQLGPVIRRGTLNSQLKIELA